MSNSFSKKKIDLEITLKDGVFGDTGSQTVNLTGLRVSADIAKSGGVAMNESLIRVWGLTQSMTNQLSTLGTKVGIQGRSTVTVSAGDDNGMSIVFSGDVFEAWAEYQSAPEVPMNLKAMSGQIANIKPTPASSFNGPVDVATIIQQLAVNMGCTFENNGVSVMLQSPNLPGTDRAKVAAAAQAARINWMIDDGVLAIWPRDGARRQNDIPTLNKDTGMVGYPTYNAMGIAVQCLYNPDIRYGTYIKVESSLPQASKTWYVYQMAHNLESETPGGQWFTSLLLTETAYGYQQ